MTFLWTVTAAGLLLGLPAHAAAQAPRTQRGDLAASIGWLYLDTRVGRPGDQARWDGAGYGGVSAGWYWTDNWKTEIDSGAASAAQGYGNENIVVDGRPFYRFRQTLTQRKTVGISQHYQFGRNAWFHPHVAAGGSLAFDTRTDQYDPVFNIYDPGRPSGMPLEPARTEGPTSVTTFRPHISGGFKAYVTQRAFVRSDVRVSGTTGRGVDEVLARIGFGIDF